VNHLSGAREADTLGRSEVETHQQGYPGHRDGTVQLAALCPLRVWLVCRQVSLSGLLRRVLITDSFPCSLWMQVSRLS
jgi:hypothetical protein